MRGVHWQIIFQKVLNFLKQDMKCIKIVNSKKRRSFKVNLLKIYHKLLKHFGEQYWWPAETKFEVIIGAILTQQTTWKNAELAIKNLKEKGLLNPLSLAKAPANQIEELIRHTGFYKQKARRIINFSKYIEDQFDGSLDLFFYKHKEQKRMELLSLEGVGLETADSILLYVGDRLFFQ